MNIYRFTTAACTLLFLIGCKAQPTATKMDFQVLERDFRSGYEALDVPGFGIAYVDNLAAIAAPEEVKRQTVFFEKIATNLRSVDPAKLTAEQYRDYLVMGYETELNLARLELENTWNEAPPEVINTGGLSTIPNGKAWYRYFLKKWVDLSVEPDSLYVFGLQEVKQVKASMLAIAQRDGRQPADFYRQLSAPERYFNSAAEVQAACEKRHQHLLTTLPKFFPKIDSIQELSIAAGTNEKLAQVPGFYRNQTFYYNYFDRPFEKRQIGWLYTHEGLPGHHYERTYTQKFANRSPLTKLFNSSSYAEGWAAYIEEIGHEFGAYPTDFDEYGKWEWDLIRSLRVPMDIGLNYYGWTDEEALLFWQQHSTGLDDIARREIARMRRWPAQVITYKYGAETFLRWQRSAARQKDFEWIDFHTRVLQYGPLPLSILEELIAKK
jgi:uncharacterized protein (DUF885 family)